MKEDDNDTPPSSPKFETPGKIGTAWGRIISADKVSAFKERLQKHPPQY